jgi:DNA polymerase III subunit delta
MVAIAAKDAEAFVRTGYVRHAVILIYGPDEGLVSERAEAIAKATVGNDHANIMRLEGDAVASNPLILADEAHSISMFGGARAIRVRVGGKSLGQALEPLLSSPPQDARIILEAGDLKGTNALRQLIEKSDKSAAIPCYAEDGRDLDRWLSSLLTEAQVQISQDARTLLLGSLGADRRLSRAEMDKLLLYVSGMQAISVADVEAIITDAAALSTDAIIDAAFLGQLDSLEDEARRLFADGVNPGVLLGFALRHALLLQTCRTEMSGDRNASESIKNKGIHFKRLPKAAEQVSRWTAVRLERAIQILGDATLASRKTASLGEAIAVRALWSLALAAGRK